ncbi:hypothetical protein L596_005814 [Steinernema carpocapsae]|uniref:BHLH domain-containing protein n=1 Tax=Steinernema carpocapsae TaxID=34508 RepID=A0A4V6I8S0_STECR|nr:hypothetical protein L596_005814 [Steinernema carpocapsae]
MSMKLSDGASLRKANKPLMEKRRRARINRCLNELKQIIMDKSRQQSATSHTKWEKADILEMTLGYIKSLQEMTVSGEQQFVAGYRKCAEQLEKFEFAERGTSSPSIVSGIREELQKMEEGAECSHLPKPVVSCSSGSPQMSPANTSNSTSPQPFDSNSPEVIMTPEKKPEQKQPQTAPVPSLSSVIPHHLIPFLQPQAHPLLPHPNPLFYMPNFTNLPPPASVFWRPF